MARKVPLLAGLFAAAMLLADTPGSAGEYSLTDHERLLHNDLVRSLMDRGPFLMIDEAVPESLKPVTLGMILDAPPGVIWQVMTDYENYGNMFMSVGKTNVAPQVIARSEAGATVRFKIELADFSLIKIYVECVQKVTVGKPQTRLDVVWEDASVVISPKGIPRWLFVKVVPKAQGWIKNASGTFEFIPLDNGKRTALFCTARADFRATVIGANTLLGKFPEIEPLVALGGLRIVMEAIEKELERIRTGERPTR